MRWLGPYRGALIGVVLVGVLLRLSGLVGDLWLDEILLLKSASAQASAWDVFSGVSGTGSHYLVGLWLRGLGPLAPAFWYRLPSLLAGVGTLIVAAFVVRREGAMAAFVAASLFAFSYPFVYYATEAQGYALAVFFALLAWHCLHEYAETRSWAHLLGFWIACVLGELSHSTFVTLFLGAFAWFLVHCLRTRSWPAAARATLAAFLLPGLCITGIYWMALRGASTPITPGRTAEGVIGETLSLLLGGPSQGAAMWAVAIIVATLAAGSLVAMMRRGDDRWVLYAGCGIVIPLLRSLVYDGPLHPRDLLVPGTFVLLAVANLLIRWLQSPTPRRAAGALVVALACGGTTVQALDLARQGRGNITQLVRRIVEWPDGPWSVSSRSEFPMYDDRMAALVEYYQRRIPEAERLTYVREASYPAIGVAWIVSEEFRDFPQAPEDVLNDFYGHQFLVDGEYVSPPLAGMSWRLYRRLSR